MSKRYFGTDGIRGRANGVITPELAMRVGMAAGIVFRNGEHRHRVIIGKDTRLSGYMIENALVSGFTSVGMDVLVTGPIPTPAIAMLTRSMRCDLGVMISASHNPYDDNGIKLFGANGLKLSDALEGEIEALIDADLSKRLAPSEKIGRAHRIDGVQDRYIEFAKLTLPRALSLQGLGIVIDCANGAAYRVAPEALWELGAEVIPLGVDPDGLNINREVGSTAPKAVAEKVREMRADLGIALDGDADRVVLVDEHGRVIDGDQLMAVVANSWRNDGRLSKPGIVATVMSNLGLERYLRGARPRASAHAGRRPLCQRGDARRRLQCRRRAVRPHHPVRLHHHRRRADRGVAGAWRSSSSDGRPASEVCHRFDPVPQVMKNFRYNSGAPLDSDRVKRAISDAEARLNGGRLVIRPSGTEPVIRVMGEGDNVDLVESVVNDIVDVLGRAA